MTSTQKVIKYVALALSILLCVGIIKGALGIVEYTTPYFDGKEATVEEGSAEMTEYAVENKPQNLEMDIRSAQLIVKTGDTFKVAFNHSNIKYESNADKLKIYENSGKKSFAYNRNVIIELTIPEGYQFNQIDIESGAGKVKIDELSANTLDIDLGAGELNVGKITALSNIDIDTGAGSVTIDNGILNNADFDLGAGEFNLIGTLTGESSIECGIGAMHLTLAGSEDDYSILFDKGIGEARINGEKAESKRIYGNGANRISIDGGIGELNVRFSDNSASNGISTL